MTRRLNFLIIALLLILVTGYNANKTSIVQNNIKPDVKISDNANQDKMVSLEKIEKVLAPINSQETAKYETLAGTSKVTALAYTPDSSVLVAGYANGQILVWNISSGANLGVLNDLYINNNPVTSLKFNGISPILASSHADGSVEIWNITSSSTSPQTDIKMNSLINTMAFSPDSSKLAVGKADGVVNVLDTTTWLSIKNISASINNVTTVDFSITGTTLLTGSSTGNISFWNVSDGSFLSNLTSSASISSMVIPQSTGTFISINTKGIVETGNITNIWNSFDTQSQSNTQPLAYYQLQGVIATAAGNEVRLWDYAGFNIESNGYKSVTDHTDNVTTLEFSPNGLMLAAGSNDHNISIYLLNNDTDSDGMPDAFELKYGLNPLINDANQDLDGDFMTNLFEYQHGYNPANPSDGLLDLDGDGASNTCELQNSLDPTNPADGALDSDGDGIPNYYECQNGLNLQQNDANSDKDSDGMPNLWEYQMGLDASSNDASGDKDKDGMPNLWEYQMGLNATFNDALLDHDGDGMPNLYEYQHGLNANLNDANLDHDGDGMPNGWEYTYGFNPNDPTDANLDADGDGATNLQEYLAGTNPRFNEEIILWLELAGAGLVGIFVLSFFVESLFKQIKPSMSKKAINKKDST